MEHPKKLIENVLRRVSVSTLIYAVLIVAILIFAASAVVAYALPEAGGWTAKIRNTLPYPVVIIGYREGVTYRTLSKNTQAVKRFYEAQDFSQIGLRVDFSTAEGEKRFQVREKEVLNKMIEDDVIQMLSKERGIRVSAAEAAQAVSRKLEEYGSGEDVKKDLERLYGWTLADFQEKVVMPGLYQEKLEASFAKEVDTTEAAKKKISAAQADLRTGTSFDLVAKQYSEGSTASAGGSLGWLALKDFAPELRTAVASQNVGVPGEILESGLGFHILLVEEVKQEEDQQLYRLSQIFTRKVMFADWLTEKMRRLPITVLAPEYRWNQEEARVEFKKQELRDFEKTLFEKTADAAFFF